MNKTLPSDEVDLLQLIETILDGKWRIIAITTACVSGVFGFQFISPGRTCRDDRDQADSSDEADEYASLNSLELF